MGKHSKKLPRWKNECNLRSLFILQFFRKNVPHSLDLMRWKNEFHLAFILQFFEKNIPHSIDLMSATSQQVPKVFENYLKQKNLWEVKSEFIGHSTFAYLIKKSLGFLTLFVFCNQNIYMYFIWCQCEALNIPIVMKRQIPAICVSIKGRRY